MKKKTFEEKKRIVLSFIKEIKAIKIDKHDEIKIKNTPSLLKYILQHITIIYKKDINIINLLKELYSVEELHKGGILIEGSHKIHNKTVCCFGNTQVEATGKSNIKAFEKSIIEAKDGCMVSAYDNSLIFAWENTIITSRDNSKIKCWNYSTCYSYDKSSVNAAHKAEIIGNDDSFIRAIDNSIVYAKDNCRVVAMYYSTIFASDKSIIELFNYARAKTDRDVTIIANGHSVIYVEDEILPNYILKNNSVLFQHNTIYTNKTTKINNQECISTEINGKDIKIDLKI
jgi:hypothetical protein|nr:MAG TPA: hypothetical protein [Caudoviricetes sp.]